MLLSINVAWKKESPQGKGSKSLKSYVSNNKYYRMIMQHEYSTETILISFLISQPRPHILLIKIVNILISLFRKPMVVYSSRLVFRWVPKFQSKYVSYGMGNLGPSKKLHP